jgi:RHS repeat-associated protein
VGGPHKVTPTCPASILPSAPAERQAPPRGNGSCLIVWPKFSAFYTQRATQTNFFGSLVNGKEDASGFTYMRNRYYNPHTGAFTQSDPIGLAGGLNTYGFAEGDPVTYLDPYGLCTEPRAAEITTCEIFARYIDRAARASRSDDEFMRTIGRQVAGFRDGRAGRDYVQPDPEVTAGWDGSGFREKYNDGDGHPWRHFTAFVVSGYQRGGLRTMAVATLWRVAAVLPNRTGGSFEDVKLGEQGAIVGHAIKTGRMSRHDLAKWIRDRL